MKRCITAILFAVVLCGPVSAAFKPTSSLRIPCRSVDVDNDPIEVVTTGRHDPCVGIRATPIVEAMLALVLADELLATLGGAAIADTDACGVDAVQVLTGCTTGKGNLIIRDWGKQVFTLGRRSDGRMVRVALRYGATNREEDRELPDAERRTRLRDRMMEMSDEELDAWIEAVASAASGISL